MIVSATLHQLCHLLYNYVYDISPALICILRYDAVLAVSCIHELLFLCNEHVSNLLSVVSGLLLALQCWNAAGENVGMSRIFTLS